MLHDKVRNQSIGVNLNKSLSWLMAHISIKKSYLNILYKKS